jgi:hypothetical protein
MIVGKGERARRFERQLILGDQVDQAGAAERRSIL